MKFYQKVISGSGRKLKIREALNNDDNGVPFVRITIFGNEEFEADERYGLSISNENYRKLIEAEARRLEIIK